MRFSVIPVVLFLFAATTSVLGQVDGSVELDDLFGRDVLSEGGDQLEARDVHNNIALALRELDEIRQRSLEHAFYVRRSIEQLERRSRSACYAACAKQYTGQNKINCMRRCDAIWK
ncbi:unnamed protein product [Cyclocybe aegerita]|uniref:Uncharacterized protein n=1 Tax=Cyclocybe aegerita TaxID=1973307 RepID=A0A8S0WLT1_CYCAE|nr:unnamed protein product [Cyclocybe aegerita]